MEVERMGVTTGVKDVVTDKYAMVKYLVEDPPRRKAVLKEDYESNVY